jgi:ABC-type hemin transport system ATPase subunit
MVVIEHDLPLLSRLSDRMLAMSLGRVIATGTPDEVRNDPAVVTSYLGADQAAIHRSGLRVATGSDDPVTDPLVTRVLPVPSR